MNPKFRLSKIFPAVNPSCDQCGQALASWTQVFWSCLNISTHQIKTWQNLLKSLTKSIQSRTNDCIWSKCSYNCVSVNRYFDMFGDFASTEAHLVKIETYKTYKTTCSVWPSKLFIDSHSWNTLVSDVFFFCFYCSDTCDIFFLFLDNVINRVCTPKKNDSPWSRDLAGAQLLK